MKAACTIDDWKHGSCGVECDATSAS